MMHFEFSFPFLILAIFFNSLNAIKLKIDDLECTLIGSENVTTWTNQKIYQFRGVRFGQTTSGENRFKEPIPAVPWPGVHNVENYGKPCPVLKYVEHFLTPEERDGDLEDCLHMSIYTKDLSDRRPVIFFIHGSSFDDGGAFQYPPNHLLEKDIVLVVTQYRLGPFGFLSTGTDAVPGSAAISDIILGLKWIQRFIHHFGGDPSCVTIFGHSAGGALASVLLFSPEVPPNLFHRAIIESGSMFSPNSFDFEPIRHATDMAQQICPTINNIEEVNKCLMNASVVDLLKSYKKHAYHQKMHYGLGDFGGAKLTFNKYIPMHPDKLVEHKCAIKDIPLIAGVTKNAGTIFYSMILEWLEQNYGLDFNKLNIYHRLDAIIEFLGVEDSSSVLAGFVTNDLLTTKGFITYGHITDYAEALIDLAGDVIFKAPLYKLAKLQAQKYGNLTHLYSYDYLGEFPYIDDTFSFGNNFKGVHHYSDLLRLFPLTFFGPTNNPLDVNMSKKIVNLWTSFAINGVPSTDGLTKWLPLTHEVGPYLHINLKSTIGHNFLDEYSVTTREAGRKIF